jgi:hypothetical protein
MTDLFLIILFLVIIVVIIVIIVIVTLFLIVRIAFLFKILNCLLFTLHASLSELFHHLEELLPVILEKIIRDSENVACE